MAQRAITKPSPSASPDDTLTTATLSVSTQGIPSYSTTFTDDNNEKKKPPYTSATTTAATLKARLQRHRIPSKTTQIPSSPHRNTIVRPSTKTSVPTTPTGTTTQSIRKASPIKASPPREQVSSKRFLVGKPPRGRDNATYRPPNNEAPKESEETKNDDGSTSIIDQIPSPKGSPGLANFLMDETFADISTIADMTMHQLDTPIMDQQTQYDRPLFSPPIYEKEDKESMEIRNKSSFQHHHAEPSHLEESYLTVGNDSIDSACLQSGGTIMIRSCSTNTTLQVDTDNPKAFVKVEPLGLCLGRREELLQVMKVNKEPSTVEELYHGDLVCFQSIFTDSDLQLGATKMGSDELQLGLFPADSNHTTWMILSAAKPEQQVLVGRAAITELQKNSVLKHKAIVIRSGDPILLRHCQTGGVLSIGDNSDLTLLTDSYARTQTLDDPGLMERLQHHDKLYPSKDDMFQLLFASTPPCPQWISGGEERIFLTGSYLLQSKRNEELESNRFDKSDLSSIVKEKILIDEIIGSFLGLEGVHIKLVKERDTDGRSNIGNSRFALFGQDGVDFDVSLRKLVEQILPLSTSYVRVQNFISSHHPGYEYGRVMQAFCEALDGLLQDYVTFVVQMERTLRKYKKGSDSSLTMKNIYFQITPSLHSMSILEHATRAVSEKKGGALINELWSLERLVYMGDVVAKRVLGILLEKSSIPYTKMLSAWLHSGHLEDPYEEFMVKRSSAGVTDSLAELDGDTWVAMFSINEDHVVDGITSDAWTKEKILTTGKYWNAAHACQVDIHTIQGLEGSIQKIPKLPFNSDSSAIASYIDVMYQSASKVLVRLLKDNFQLIESLNVMKRYFLLDQGDFLMHFLDAAEEELLKPSGDVSIGRIQNWLSMSIQLTEGHRDGASQEKENKCPLVAGALRCKVVSNETLQSDGPPLTPARHAYGAKKGPTAIERFTIDFPHLPFPISLVLSNQAMKKYKLLFRQLFVTKHVERRLIAVWCDHQMLKKLDSLRGLLGPTLLLRQRMLHFVQNLLYYMSFEVIANNWTDMISSIDTPNTNRNANQKQQTVDDILKVHNGFLQKTLEACLLTNPVLIKSLTKILSTCLLFTDQMRRFMDSTKIVSFSCMSRGVKFFCLYF